MDTRYGPRPGEGRAARHGPVDRVAVLSDVHANVPALQALLAVDEVVSRCAAVGDPEAERITNLLTSPPTVAEVIAHAESKVFAD